LLAGRDERMIPGVRPDLPTGTVTFLFTDVEGSTSLLNELGAEVYAAAHTCHTHFEPEERESRGFGRVRTEIRRVHKGE